MARPGPFDRPLRFKLQHAQRAPFLAGALACALSVGGCKERVRVADSVCSQAEDCLVNPSCARRVNGCTCESGSCWFDPSAAINEQGIGCRACHGSLLNPAPPRSLSGAEATTEIGVGAHQRHLSGGDHARPVACSECHLVPQNVDDPGHNDTPLPAELTFGGLASARGAQPSWDRATGRCASYCHGQTINGGTNPTPLWTQVDGTEAACGSCHGIPPGGNHVNDDSCELCHEPTAGRNHTIVNRATHVDGVVQVTGGHCGTCHGDPSRPAPLNASPPRDLNGKPSSNKVGAHMAHLTPVNSADVACDACHKVPLTFSSPGHVDDADRTAEITFGGLAVDPSGPPSYDFASMRCSNTYCHGASIAGGTNGGQAVWIAGAKESQCTACHGAPPPTAAHAAVSPTVPCGGCHKETASATQPATIVARQFHADGTLQVSGCGMSCHEVPPAVGAHAMHAGTQGFECALCHGHNGSGPTHNQGNGVVLRANVDVVFTKPFSYPGGTTLTNGGTPSYDPVTMSCAVGCHNPIRGNPNETPNLKNRPVFTQGPINCRDCHDEIGGAPPYNHNVGNPDRPGCQTCHDMSAHRKGAVRLKDNDPTDSYVPTLGTIDPLCKGCHDGGGGTFFGAKTPPNVMAGWYSSSHALQGFRCNDCHTYHVSTTNTQKTFVNRNNGLCLKNCHQPLYDPPNGPFTYAGSHHQVDPAGGPGTLMCIHCHNPHLAQAPPNAASDPDNKWQLYPMPTSAASQRIGNAVDTRHFCLACHDGAPPPGVPTTGLDIQQALNGGAELSQYSVGGMSLHRNKHGGFNCVTCHDWHGTPGTQGINRGRTLAPFIRVDSFPYQGDASCYTSSSGQRGRYINGTWVSYSLGCH